MAAEPGRASSWEPPPDWQEGPRVSGPYTFMRIPPGRHLKAGDVAIIGVPFDAGTTYRPGARFGPRALRTASAHLRPYPRQESGLFPPFDRLHILDYGDVDVIPYDLSETMTRIEQALTPLCEAGVFPLILGGDHSITLPVLRALAAKHGSLALVHFDAHPDYWEPPLWSRRPRRPGSMSLRGMPSPSSASRRRWAASRRGRAVWRTFLSTSTVWTQRLPR